MPVGLPWSSADPHLPALLPNRPPWRSAPNALNPSWTGSFGLWGRLTTLAASPVWCATVDLMAFRSRWMPPARSTALRTSTGQSRFPHLCLRMSAFPIFLNSSCPSTSPFCLPPLPCLVRVNIAFFPKIQDHTSGLSSSLPHPTFSGLRC